MTWDRGTASRGSEWRRWDPHLHAPGTLLNDQFAGDWNAYLTRLETSQPAVMALGVTDYFCIRTYREVRRRKVEEGRLPNVDLIFPNVEMRLDIKTDRTIPINIHLLFSPEDPDHETEIVRALGRLECEFQGRPWRCVEDDLMKIGRISQPWQKDDHAALSAGAQQFKVTLDDLRRLYRGDKWMQRNCLVAVAGSRNDGTSGLQRDDSYVLMRREIERFAHIIFASTPSQREYWLGKRPGTGVAYIETTYGSLKPCLHGSDAHAEDAVATPPLDRYTWIKGDPTFEALRQAVIEPDERVWIGPTPPSLGASTSTIRSVQVTGAPWLAASHINLNPGFVAIIGERGSGKTALVEILARGAHAARGQDRSSASFLRRATDPIDLIGEASVRLEWSDDTTTESPVHPDHDAWDEPDSVCYLSQQFVEQLCSSAGVATQLREEIERVIFGATPATDRFDATCFGELAEVWLEPIRRRRVELRGGVDSIGDDIEREEQLRSRLGGMQKERGEKARHLEASRKDLAKMLPTGKDERAKRLLELEKACAAAETAIEGLRRKLKRVEDLAGEVAHIRSHTEPTRLSRMRSTFAGVGLSDDDWKKFELQFVGDVDGVIRSTRQEVERAVAFLSDGDPQHPVELKSAPLARWPLRPLQAERDKVKKDVGIDDLKQRKYSELNNSITSQESALRKLDEEIRHAEGADVRRNAAIDARRRAYVQVFDTLVEEEKVLATLYAPLATRLVATDGAVSKLAFKVEREVDLDAWVTAGEELLDLRSATRFRGRGALRGEAERSLLAAWRTGGAEAVARAMDQFREAVHADLNAAMPPSVGHAGRAAWVQRIARWLYSTEHINIRYSITYEGVRVEQLSPGTRGIVLLLLFLAVDHEDQRPLVVDQPEENLDPKSVFDELVPHFRAARRRRQIIVVTHNANLVVNTDADQVLVASATHHTDGELPTITYAVGTLENPAIRAAVCATLEGGERAFLDRERRYRLRWGELHQATPTHDGADLLLSSTSDGS